MKKAIYSFIILFLTFLVGCTNINTLKSNNIMLVSDNAFKYIGTWEVIGCKSISDSDMDNYEDNISKLSNGIQISKDAISIFGTIVKGVRYKLKVVEKDYIISYEHNLTAERFMNDKDKMDIISVIDNNITLCEFAIINDKNIIMIYKSWLISLKKVSNDVTFNINLENNKDNIINDNNDSNSDIGVMIGLKTPRYIKEDGTYSEEEYRTVWISYKNHNIDTIYEKQNIIFPRMNGIWLLEAKNNALDNKHFDYFQVTSLDGKVIKISDYNTDSSIYKSINFIGNDYASVEIYTGENFINEYPIHQIIPVDNINSNNGLSIEEIFNKDMKDVYSSDFKNTFESIPDNNKLEYKDLIYYNDIKMQRNDGRWVLEGQIRSSEENKEGKDFILSAEPNKKLVNYNSVLIPWKLLKGEVPFLKDAISSPNGEIAIVKYEKYLVIYKIDNGHLSSSPLENIILNEGEEIIMAEWCSNGYIDDWQKAFEDGTNLIREDE